MGEYRRRSRAERRAKHATPGLGPEAAPWRRASCVLRHASESGTQNAKPPLAGAAARKTQNALDDFIDSPAAARFVADAMAYEET